MVSHGNSFQSFLELTDPEAKKKFTIGIGYCCISMIQRESRKDEKPWEMKAFGDGTHVNTGTTEILVDEYYIE